MAESESQRAECTAAEARAWMRAEPETPPASPHCLVQRCVTALCQSVRAAPARGFVCRGMMPVAGYLQGSLKATVIKATCLRMEQLGFSAEGDVDAATVTVVWDEKLLRDSDLRERVRLLEGKVGAAEEALRTLWFAPPDGPGFRRAGAEYEEALGRTFTR